MRFFSQLERRTKISKIETSQIKVRDLVQCEKNVIQWDTEQYVLRGREGMCTNVEIKKNMKTLSELFSL